MATKISRLLSLLLSAALLCACAGCGEKNPTDDPSGNDPTVYEVFDDGDFGTGFDIYGTGYDDAGNVVQAERALQKTIKFGKSAPAWSIAQWYSHYKLDRSEYILNENTFSISDTSKTVAVDRKSGAITLSMNAGKEYDGIQNAGSLGYYWPHLLISPTETEPVKIADCETMTVYLDFCIDKSEHHAADFGAEKPGLQAQFAWFVYVQNLTEGSAGYGEFLWFGFNLYDPTQLYAPHNEQQDFAGGNAGNYIYTLGATECIGTSRVKVGERTGFSMDLIAAVEKGLAAAHEAGFMTNSELEDCSITGMNIGYEMFDVWDISTTIYDMGVSYTLKEEA